MPLTIQLSKVRLLNFGTAGIVTVASDHEFILEAKQVSILQADYAGLDPG
jgi:hypothetical protein